ncbi:MAG: MerR family DNA-binding transcriptional regulator [Acidimicrobiales bacterium]|nr:MerR family DNA-binding transcriptional regulator [Acidimicrobiales bacterium]
MPERSHLSIGEVLSLLREEFPDVTISKIRFLESQGLVDPERTPSGYRKFYEPDVERLRWILRQQREHFLPLKVIRGRLSEQETGAPDPTAPDPTAPDSFAQDPVTEEAEDHQGSRRRARPEGADGPTRTPAAVTAAPGREAMSPPSPARSRGAPPMPSLFAGLHSEGAPARPVSSGAQPDTGPGTGRRAGSGSEGGPPGVAPPSAAGPEQPDPTAPHPTAPDPAAPQRRPAQPSPPLPPTSARPAGPPAAADRTGSHPGIGPGASSPTSEAETFTVEELAAAVGTTPTFISELKQYGLISPHAMAGGVAYFDESAVAVARCASELAGHGVEPRHLRIWRNAADREADLFQQIVLPLLRQRNPQSRRQAVETLADLARLGRDLRAALVDRALREIR